MFLNNDWVKEEIREWTKIYRDKWECQYNIEVWGNAAKLFIRETLFLSLQAYLKKLKQSEMNNFTVHLKELEKEQSSK